MTNKTEQKTDWEQAASELASIYKAKRDLAEKEIALVQKFIEHFGDEDMAWQIGKWVIMVTATEILEMDKILAVQLLGEKARQCVRKVKRVKVEVRPIVPRAKIVDRRKRK